MPTAQETFVSNMNALASAIHSKTGASLPLSIVGMKDAVNTLAFETAKIIGAGDLDFSNGLSISSFDPDSGYTHMAGVAIYKPTGLDASNIRYSATEPVVIAGIQGSFTYLSAGDNPAGVTHILAGHKAYANGILLSGTYSVGTYTIASTANFFSSASTSQYVISKTTWTSNAISQLTINRPADLVANKIATGATIFGVAGSYETATIPLAINLNFSDGTNLTFTPTAGKHYSQVTVNIPATKAEMEAMIAYSSTLMGIAGKFTSDATATNADIIYSKTAYVKGSKITGAYKISTATVAAGALTFSTSNKYVVSPPSGYNAVTSVTINQPTNLVAANIKGGDGTDAITIAGIKGTFTNPGTLSKVSGDTHGGTETANDEIITKDLIGNKIAYSKGKKYKGNYWVGSYNASTSDFVFINDSSTLTITINNVSSSDAASSIVLPTASALGLVASNIKKDVTIMGITGTYDNYPTTQQKTVTFSGNGQQVTPDSGKVLTKVTINAPGELIAANIKQGAIIAGVTGNFTASDSTSVSIVDSSLSGTWTSANILSGKTAYLHGHKVEGTITSKAAATYYTSTSNQKVDKNQYLTGDQTILAVMTSNLDGANIRYGAKVKVGDSNNRSRIAEVDGTYSYVSDSAADESKILNGYKAFVNGESVMTGNYKTGIYVVPANTITLSNGGTIDISSSSLNAMTKVTINTNSIVGLSADKIQYNQSVAGITGTYTGDGTLTGTGSGTTKSSTQLRSGVIAYSKGVRYQGSMSENAGGNYAVSTSGRSISKDTYLTGAINILGVTYTASAPWIVSGYTIKIGDSADDDRIVKIDGTAPSEEQIYQTINGQLFG